MVVELPGRMRKGIRDCSIATGADSKIARQEQGESTWDPLDASELASNSANGCRLQAEWAPLWEASGYHLSGCGADCSTTLGIKPVRRLDSRPLRDCRADQGRIDSLSGPGRCSVEHPRDLSMELLA